MTTDIQFIEFPKIARLSRECVITEKIDGTNGQIYITEDCKILAGSRTRWVFPGADNYGFAAWVESNREELITKLGPGQHFGEWWGAGIQRRYNQTEKRFSLFNVSRWNDPDLRPACCSVVPTLFVGEFTTEAVNAALESLKLTGSMAAPGFDKPEGIVIYHTASRQLFKKSIEKDEEPKGKFQPIGVSK